MAFILKDGQQVPLSLRVLDAEGNPAAIQGPPMWTSSDPSLVALTWNIDNPSMAVAATVPGPGLGTAAIEVGVDADLGDGVETLTGVLDIEVVAADAAVVNLEPGQPEARTEAPITPTEPAPADVPADIPPVEQPPLTEPPATETPPAEQPPTV